MRKRYWIVSALAVVVLAGGCGLLPKTIGPQVETRFVLVDVGNPVLVLQARSVVGRPLDASDEVKPQKMKINGFVAMPLDHWEVIKERYQRMEDELNQLKEVKDNGS